MFDDRHYHNDEDEDGDEDDDDDNNEDDDLDDNYNRHQNMADDWLMITIMMIINILITTQSNIARGTTDPGYCLFNMSYLSS